MLHLVTSWMPSAIDWSGLPKIPAETLTPDVVDLNMVLKKSRLSTLMMYVLAA